jgi:hypothetical protein
MNANAASFINNTVRFGMLVKHDDELSTIIYLTEDIEMGGAWSFSDL